MCCLCVLMEGWIESIDILKEGIEMMKRIYPLSSIGAKKDVIICLKACVHLEMLVPNHWDFTPVTGIVHQLIVQLTTDYEMKVITFDERGHG